MKRVLAVFFFVVMLHPMFASNISESEVSNALVAITDLGFVTVGNFITLGKNNFSSIAIRVSPTTSLPDSALFNNADLSDFLVYFDSKKEKKNFFTDLLPTIDPIIKERLILNDWKEDEAIVTGAIGLAFPENLNFQQLITESTSGVFPNVGVSFNFLVTGSLFSDDINIKGILFISADQYGVPQVTPYKLLVNEQDYDLTFFERAPLLLTMKNDI